MYTSKQVTCECMALLVTIKRRGCITQLDTWTAKEYIYNKVCVDSSHRKCNPMNKTVYKIKMEIIKKLEILFKHSDKHGTWFSVDKVNLTYSGRVEINEVNATNIGDSICWEASLKSIIWIILTIILI